MNFIRKLLCLTVSMLLLFSMPAAAEQESQNPHAGDYFKCVLDGTEYVLPLVQYADDMLWYGINDPLGNSLWRVEIVIEPGADPGTVYDYDNTKYHVIDGIFKFEELNLAKFFNVQYETDEAYILAAGGYTVDTRSEDWRTYSGSVNATFKQKSGKKTIEIADGFYTWTYTDDMKDGDLHYVNQSTPAAGSQSTAKPAQPAPAANDKTETRECFACKGTGKCRICDGKGTLGDTGIKCNSCMGTGICAFCNGTGTCTD